MLFSRWLLSDECLAHWFISMSPPFCLVGWSFWVHAFNDFVTKIVRHGHCEDLESKASFNPILSKILLRDFHGPWDDTIIPSFAVGYFWPLPLLRGQQGSMFLSLFMNSELTCSLACQAPVSSLSLLPPPQEGRDHFPHNLLPVPSFKKFSSFKSLSGPYF